MKSIILSTLNMKLTIRFALLLTVWIFSDAVLDLSLSLLHSTVLLLHYLFEFLEHSLDVLIEHLFHTDPRTTEIIVFYILAFVLGGIAFKIIKMLPNWYCKICERLINYFEVEKNRTLIKWQNQSLSKKLKWGSVFITGSMFMLIWALN